MTKKRKTNKRRHTLQFMLPGLEKFVKRAVPCSDARSSVDLEREEIDVIKGIAGMGIECMNAQCGLRQREKFPHEVFAIEFDDSRAFVVDRLTKEGMPAHCIRYYHHEGDEQKEFDVPGGKQRLLRSGKVKKIVRLLAPTRSIKHIPNPNPRPRKDKGHRDPRTRIGAVARWLRSKAAA